MGESEIEVFPDTLNQNLSKLRKLDISGNSFHQVPSNIGKISKFIFDIDTFNKNNKGLLLNLTAVSIGGSGLTLLADEICNLSSLRYLIISFNELTRLPSNIGALENLLVPH